VILEQLNLQHDTESIDIWEVQQVLDGISDTEMLAIDLDDDNMITYYEICMHYILPKVEVICQDEMKLSFLANDSDGDEKISLEELIDADIGIEDPESVELFFNIIDMDNDG